MIASVIWLQSDLNLFLNFDTSALSKKKYILFYIVTSSWILSEFHLDLNSRQSTKLVWKFPIAVYTVLRLLLRDSRTVWNMYSFYQNKFEKKCITLSFVIRIYHDESSSECQILQKKLSVLWFGKSSNLFRGSHREDETLPLRLRINIFNNDRHWN
jgi:hypothetical protein